MNPNIKEMEQKLREAKREEAEAKALLEKFEKTMTGKVFMVSCSHPNTKYNGGWKNCRLLKFDSFELQRFSAGVSWSGEEVNVHVAACQVWGFSYKKVRQSSASSLASPPGTEISLELFKAAVAYSKAAAKSAMGYLREIHDDKRALDWKPEPRPVKPEEVDVTLDLPHVQLVNSEITILGDTMFATIDNRYLITPASVILAQSLINKAQVELDAGSAFYQECDMRYVRSRHEMLRELLAKVKKAAK